MSEFHVCISANCSVGKDWDILDEGCNVQTVESAALFLEDWAGKLRDIGRERGYK